MTLKNAIKAINNYMAERADAEKQRKSIFWLNPVFSEAIDGRYKTSVDGVEYIVALVGFDGWPPEGYLICSGKEQMTIKNEDLIK